MPLKETVTEFFSRIGAVVSSFSVVDFIDICFVAFVIYSGIKIIRETRAFQLAKGFVLLGAVYLVINLLNMQASEYLFNKVFTNAIIVMIILFQPEIRKAIEKMGGSRLRAFDFLGINANTEKRNDVIRETIIETAKACQRMSDKRIGSIIIFERETLLGDSIKTGTPVDAKITHELIGNIFFPNSPLHDGAAIIRDGRLECAGCVLPLTKSDLGSDLGMRHRAAIGVTEESDAVVVVTSEETGIISLAYRGNFVRNLTEAQLREELMGYMIKEETQTPAPKKVLETVKEFLKGNKK